MASGRGGSSRFHDRGAGKARAMIGSVATQSVRIPAGAHVAALWDSSRLIRSCVVRCRLGETLVPKFAAIDVYPPFTGRH